MEFEILTVEQIHIVVAHKSVRDERNTRVGQRLITAVESEIVDVGTVFAKCVDVLFSHLIGRNDKVDCAARRFFDGVDSVLNRTHAHRFRNGFGVRFEEGIIASFKSVDIFAVAEYCFESRDFVAFGALHVHLAARA